MQSKRWIHGPVFLWKNEEERQKQAQIREVQEDDLEVRIHVKACGVVTTDTQNPMDRIIQHFSSLYQLKKCIAWLLRYRSRLLLASRRRKDGEKVALLSGEVDPVSTDEVNSAEVEILKYVQEQSFVEFVFSPFEVWRGRSLAKCYGVLHTCLSKRAIHTEVIHIMDTDSFLNSMRRFIARRGNLEVVRSDNGTIVVSGIKELRQAIAEWNANQVHEFMIQRNIKWLFNPPTGFHHGGAWERCIRTVRKVLSSMVKEQVLDDEALSILMSEVEAVVNGRPITKTSHDAKDMEALTPNHLLLLQSGSRLPPGAFSRDDTYSRRRWRQVQYLANVFWRRWVNEYLPRLQELQKWLKPSRNFAVNDIVLVVDDKLPRSFWSLGRVIGAHKSQRDGSVRSVTIKTNQPMLDRPINKIVLLETVEISKDN